MNWQTFSDHLAAQHGTDHQAIYKVEHAIRAIHEALDLLATLGHPFHLESGPPPATPEWPKVMFHESCQHGQLVHCAEDLADLGDGWRPSLAEARYAHGLRQQFKLRGGVKLRDVPAILAGHKVEGENLSREERIKRAQAELAEYLARGVADDPPPDPDPIYDDSDDWRHTIHAEQIPETSPNDAGC